jgi:protein N-lysine methyltransferase METTL21D
MKRRKRKKKSNKINLFIRTAMNGGREKIGDSVAINWQEFAFGLQKFRRKTVGFGKKTGKKSWEDEVYLREMSITEAGIGCALWDAAIIISRCLDYYGKLNTWKNQRMIELGAGVGLPGIVCARFAKQVVITDCLESLVQNLKYNVSLNSNPEDSLEPILAENVRNAALVDLLDWHDVDQHDFLKRYSADGQPFDIVFGSELVYTGDKEHIQFLIRVVDRILKPDGIFYSIQSTDRDGMKLFVELLNEAGFNVQDIAVPEHFLGDYGTNQLPETYKFYSVWRKQVEVNYPIFGKEK